MRINILIFFASLSILTLITCKNEQELRFNTKITRIDTLKQVEPIINDVVISEMSQAYGFNFAQMYSLKLIKINNPNLEGKVELAKLKFEKSFDNSIITIDSILSTHNSKWREIKDKLSGQINTRTETNSYSLEEISNFITLVEKRANGDITNPIIGTLLSFNPKYLKNPAYEFLDGFKYRYSSIENNKAKGLVFHIDIPQSWLARDGDRPNVVQKFISQNGHGISSIVILVLEMQGVSKISENDIRELARKEELIDMLPTNAQFLDGGYNQIDNLPGIYLEYKIIQTKMSTQLFVHTINYNCYFNNKVLSIQCMVSGPKDEETYITSVFNKNIKLFELVAGSLVLQNQWIN